MNLNSNTLNSNLSALNKETANYSASRYALQVALQTMKERCQKLQGRLSCLEEENLQLRIEKHKLSVTNKNEASISVSAFEKKVAELNRQKSQLSHHILMVATENKELWQRLSKLTEENESLGHHLNNISDSLNKQQFRTLKPDKSINIVDSCSKRKDGKDDSLEEISLKVLNSLIKGKTTKENQSDEASELQNGNTVSLDQCGFTLGGSGEKLARGTESLTHELKQILERMKAEKTQLKQQQESLKVALAVYKKISDYEPPCSKCASMGSETKSKESERRGQDESKPSESGLRSHSETPSSATTLQMTYLNREVAGKEVQVFEDRICPLCTTFYHSSTPFDDFNDHVLSHFVEEEGGEDSIVTNFEVII